MKKPKPLMPDESPMTAAFGSLPTPPKAGKPKTPKLPKAPKVTKPSTPAKPAIGQSASIMPKPPKKKKV